MEGYIKQDYEDEFDLHIMKRGEEYYKNNRVKRCFKTNDDYISVVKGSNADYIVRIYDYVDSDYLYMECTCPYDGNCKHEYATLLAIRDRSYSEFEFKDEVPEKNYNLKSIVESIPAEKLKEYILTKGADFVVFETNYFEQEFFDYLPKQLEDYYYNSLYNSYVLKVEFADILNKHINSSKKYLEKENYLEAFNIIKSIIKVYIDLNIEDECDELPSIYSTLGMYLRIIYRKCNNEIKKNINLWIKELEKENYNNNIYLEDIILTIK